jgi:acyl-CoA synthetase (AMP-forming)/AMP-acid ligase II
MALNDAQPPVFKTLAELTPHFAAQKPNKVALVHAGRSTTYGELDVHSRKVAAGLAAEGFAKGDRVAFLALNSDHYIELLLGVGHAGMVMVGVNWRLVAREVAYIINDAAAKVIFTEQLFLPIVEEILSQCPTVQRVVLMDSPTPDYADYVTWRDAQAPATQSVGQPNDTLLQMYTSGTTGFPKGALMANSGLLAAAAKSEGLLKQDWAQWDDTDVSIVAMPVFHIGGTGWAIMALLAGGKAVILSKPDIPDIVENIAAHRVTKMFAVPAVLNAILAHPEAATADFSSVREVLYGASPIPLDVLRRAMQKFSSAQFIQCYGATETCGTVVYLPPEDHDPAGNKRMLSCGIPFPGNKIRIVDGDGKEAATGDVGEIWIQSPSLMQGYHNMPEATAKALKDGWYASGDAGYLDEDGYLYIYDRVKDMIVSGAENIYPAEVENALHEHPAVQDCAVIGVPDAKWGEAVKAIIVLRAGQSATPDELIAFSRERIAGYKVPKSVDFVTELPRNPSGKVLKRELRKAYWPEDGRQVA